MYITDIAMAALIILAGIGAAQVLCGIWAWLTRPGRAPGDIIVLPVRGSVENIEQLVRYYENRLCLGAKSRDSRLILLDMGASGETLEVCRRMCAGRFDIVLCRPEQIISAIE